MFKNSGLYNPIRNPEGVTNRRNVVLSKWQKENHHQRGKPKFTNYQNFKLETQETEQLRILENTCVIT
jgi:penicillin-binding protein 1A